jgi:ubiquinone/menaquinone biosynthesis C-methylase UbiE
METITASPVKGAVDPQAALYLEERKLYWNRYIRKKSSGHYHKALTRIYRSLIQPDHRVLEVGCGEGELLSAVEPSVGVGIDISTEMLKRAAARHPKLHLIEGDVHNLAISSKFDYIILSDLVNDLWDVQQALARLKAACLPNTRVIINSYSRLWELPLASVRRLGLANPVLGQNWLTPEDIANLLLLSGFEMIRRWREILCPVGLPLIRTVCNKYLVRVFPFNHFALTNFIVARPLCSALNKAERKPSVTVVVPARNEAGNIEDVFRRVPEMGGGTEILFVEGHSKDGTYETIERAMTKYPERHCKLLRQSGVGKGDAVRLGFERAAGDVLMILDADLTVPPEDLPRFFEALLSGKGELINGVRLVYPMERRAMRFLNLVGNKFFSLAISWLLGQTVKDTLCGTKVLMRNSYQAIAQGRVYFGDFDPFGDFDLIFGAARLNLRILDMPIRYRERTYGETNIARWKHGWLLVRMLAFASRRFKFT